MINLTPIVDTIVMAAGSVLGGLIVYIAIQVRQIYIGQQLHNRMIFGEDGIEGWDGLLRICLNNRKYITQLTDILDDVTLELSHTYPYNETYKDIIDRLQGIRKT